MLVINGVAEETGGGAATYADVYANSTVDHPGTDFTAVPGNGYATPATFSLGYNAGFGGGVWADYCKLILDLDAAAVAFDLRARLAASSGDANTFIAMGVRDAAGASLLWMQVNRANGIVDAFDNGGGLATAPLGTFGFVGDDWMRMVFENGLATIYTGQTSGGDILWTRLWAGRGTAPTVAQPVAPWTFVNLVFHVQQTVAAGAILAQWADCAVTALV